MAGQLWWYTARAGGIVSWALLSASVLWGLAMSTRVLGKLAKRPWLLDLHRYLGGLAVVFVAVHVASIMFDTYVRFGWTDVLVPFASSWNPGAVAWGIVAMYLLLAVELTSLARNRLSRRAWHAVHLASFPLFAFSTIHLLVAGTDAPNSLLRFSALVVSSAVGALVVRRVLLTGSRRSLSPPRVRPQHRLDVGGAEREHLERIAGDHLQAGGLHPLTRHPSEHPAAGSGNRDRRVVMAEQRRAAHDAVRPRLVPTFVDEHRAAVD